MFALKYYIYFNAHSMIDKKDLFNITEHPINGKKGTVLAIATYVDRQMICFCPKGETVGSWISPSNSISVTKNNLSNPISKSSTAQRNNSQNETSQKAQSNTDNWQQLLSELFDEYSNSQFDKYQKEIESIKKDISSSNKEDLTGAIINKFIAETVSGSIYGTIISGLKDFSFRNDFSQSFLSLLKSYNMFSIEDNKESSVDADAVWESMQHNLNILIPELRSAIDIGHLFIGTKKYMSLLVELVYKIGYVYGFDHRSDKSEFNAILSIALSSSIIKKIGVDTTMNHTSMLKGIIDPLSNIVTFIIVGYTARCYYQSATSIQLQDLSSKVQFYIENNLFQRKATKMLGNQY